MKDAGGHGSNPRGVDQAHLIARRVIQLHPDDPHPVEENTLRSYGYSPSQIQTLRLNAGAAVADTPAAHQAGVERATRQNLAASLTRAELERLAGVKQRG